MHYGTTLYANEPPAYKLTQFPKRPAMLLGIIHISCGILCIIFQSLAIAVETYLSVLAHGIWCGILFIITGGFGLGAASGKTKCLISSFLVLSIISAPFALLVIILSTFGYSKDIISCDGYYDWENDVYVCYVDKQRAQVAMNAVLLVVSYTEAITAILSAVLCSLVHCCCRLQREADAITHTVRDADWQHQQHMTEGVTSMNPSQNAFEQKAPPHYETLSV